MSGHIVSDEDGTFPVESIRCQRGINWYNFRNITFARWLL